MFIDFAARVARVPFIRLGAAGTEAKRYALLLGLAVLGAVLRMRGAEGDLWLDEIWTLRLLERVGSIADIFLGIHHDNNHVLNSAWLWLVGPDAPVVVLRLAAVVCGTLAVPAAAAAVRRSGDAAAVSAALLVAAGYFFVHYGSEARGYAAMTLAILLACAALETVLADPSARHAYLAFGLAVCFGAFAHLTMIEATGALCLTAFARSRQRPSGVRAGALVALGALGSAPALACFLFGALAPDFQVGAMVPFSVETLAEGLAGMIRAVFGCGGDWSDATVVVAASGTAAALLALAPAERRWFPAIAIFGLPILHAAIGLPSQQYPRFHTTAAVGSILLCAEAFAVLWRRDGVARAAAICALGSITIGDGIQLARFFELGRGHYADAVRAIGETSPATYAVDFAKGETKAVLGYYSARLAVGARPVADARWCESPPAWLIVVDLPTGAPDLAERRSAGPEPCRTPFARFRTFPAWGLSGFTWTLYRRDQ